MPAGQVAGSRPAGLAPASPSRALAMAKPVAWAGKKQARMAPTPSCACAQLTSRGPALNSSRMRGRPAAAGRWLSLRAHSGTAGMAPGCPMDGEHLGGLRSHRAPTCLHSILQQVQLVPRQGQVPPVSCFCLHIYSWVETAKGEPLTPLQTGQRGTDSLRGGSWALPLSQSIPPGSAHPVSSHSDLPVPRQTTTMSAAPTTFTSSAREYCQHRGSLQPAVKLTLAPSISSPILHQRRAEDTGAAVTQSRATMRTGPLPWPPAKGQAAPATALDSAQKKGTGERGREVGPLCLTGVCRCTEDLALVHSPQTAPGDCQQRDPQPAEGRGVRAGTSSPVTPVCHGCGASMSLCPPPYRGSPQGAGRTGPGPAGAASPGHFSAAQSS